MKTAGRGRPALQFFGLCELEVWKKFGKSKAPPGEGALLFSLVMPIFLQLKPPGLLLEHPHLVKELGAHRCGLLAAGGIGLDHHRDLPDALGHLGNGGRLGDIPHGAVKECHNLPAGAGLTGTKGCLASAGGNTIRNGPIHRFLIVAPCSHICK